MLVIVGSWRAAKPTHRFKQRVSVKSEPENAEPRHKLVFRLQVPHRSMSLFPLIALYFPLAHVRHGASCHSLMNPKFINDFLAASRLLSASASCGLGSPKNPPGNVCKSTKTKVKHTNRASCGLGSPKNPPGDVCKPTKTKGKHTNRVPYAASCGLGSPKNPQGVYENIQKPKENIQIGSPMLRRVVGGPPRIPKEYMKTIKKQRKTPK